MNLLREFFERRHVLLGIISGVQTLLGHAAIFQRPVSCLIERNHIRAAQTKVRAQWCALLVLGSLNSDENDPAPRKESLDATHLGPLTRRPLARLGLDVVKQSCAMQIQRRRQ